MIIDCHGHFTTVPGYFREYRKAQIADFEAGKTSGFDPAPKISDDEIREGLENNQLKRQREMGVDMVLFSPIAGLMGHNHGNEALSQHWSRTCNDLIARVCELYPHDFAPVGQLPQSVGVSPTGCIDEMERCVDMGFVGFNLNPDPTGGFWTEPPLTDPQWFPLYEKMCELKVPAMIHVSGSATPSVHGTGAYYLNGNTAAFMQLLEGDVFQRYPDLKFIIPHGGGSVPYHWGRYRGLAADRGLPSPDEMIGDNLLFDTCVYYQPGLDLLAATVPADNIIFGSEMIGAVRGIDPETDTWYDNTPRFVNALNISDADKQKIFEGNARRIYPRLDNWIKAHAA